MTEWDESGYLAIAFNDTNSLLHHGLHGLASAFVAHGFEAPFVPLASVPVLLLLGRGVDQGLVVPVMFYAVLVLCTYLLAVRLTTPAWAAVATLTVAAIPGITDYSRLFHFVVPAAALLRLRLWLWYVPIDFRIVPGA